MPRWLFALALAWLGPARGEQGLAIALHAQSKSEIHGWVAGSEITTRALREALLARRDVSACAVFAPRRAARTSGALLDARRASKIHHPST
mmetsp:Transcript_12517/g.37213  ORF Transcript_12517/g.37213 Transcript_12517/m.37213 type:complete len:91 (-) Transcript_12517:1304-1576(-)